MNVPEYRKICREAVNRYSYAVSKAMATLASELRKADEEFFGQEKADPADPAEPEWPDPAPATVDYQEYDADQQGARSVSRPAGRGPIALTTFPWG